MPEWMHRRSTNAPSGLSSIKLPRDQMVDGDLGLRVLSAFQMVHTQDAARNMGVLFIQYIRE
jgi:hypothetical protein